MKYLKLEKTLEESVKEKAELVLEIDRITKARKKAMRMYEEAENELQKLRNRSAESSSINSSKGQEFNGIPGRHRTRLMLVKAMEGTPSPNQCIAVKWVAILEVTIQNLRDDLEATLRDKVSRAGFPGSNETLPWPARGSLVKLDKLWIPWQMNSIITTFRSKTFVFTTTVHQKWSSNVRLL